MASNIIPIIAAVAFLSGTLLSTVFDSHRLILPDFIESSLEQQSVSHEMHDLKAQSSIHSPSNISQPPPSVPAVPEIPLALQWYRKSFENPWAFSTRRTNISILQKALEQTLERDGKLPRVVVSFTSLPKRLNKYALNLLRVIKTQEYLPDLVYANIPLQSRRAENNSDFEIPQWLSEDALVKVIRPGVDYGPGTKLIPALQEEIKLGHMDTRIITVDDDNEGGWGPNNVIELLAYSLLYDDAAIGFTGWNATCMVKAARCSPEDSGVPQRQYRDRFYNFVRRADDYACHTLLDWRDDYFEHCMGAVRKNHVGYTDVIEGYKGALYQPKMFDMDMIETLMDSSTPDFFFYVDDVWISGCLSLRGVPRLVINPALSSGDKVREELISLSDKRGLSRDLLVTDVQELIKNASGGTTEPGLHSLGSNFVRSNHDGVQWFEEKGAWTKGMWDRPAGFSYPSEGDDGGGGELTGVE